MLNVVLILSCLILLLLAGIVLYSNSRAAANRWLGAFLISGFLWVFANALANNAPSNTLNLIFSRGALIGATLAPLSFLMFCLQFTGSKVVRSFRNQFIIYLPVMLLLLTVPTKLNVVTASKSTFAPGISYLILLVILLVYFGYSIALLVREYMHAKQERREQVRYMLMGTAATIIPAAVISGILPLFGRTDLAPGAPALVIVMSGYTTVAIVRHRLFNVRSFVFRSIAYTISTLLVGVVFIAPLLYLVTTVMMGFPFELGKFITGVIIATVAATNYARLRSLFDTLTRRVFFRDSYDSAALLGRLNRLLVSTTDLRRMLHDTADMITGDLKSEFCVFTLQGSDMRQQRIIGTVDKKITHEMSHPAVRLMQQLHMKVLVTDYIDPEFREIKEVLAANGIAAIAQLSPSSGQNETVGYMFLGYKRSGNPYNSQDVHTLQTITDVLFIAVQNALHYEEIQKFNITLQERITEATSQLRRTNAKLKALDETKDDFISMASHQLRTPLTSVKGYLSMVLDGDAGKITPMQHKMLDQAFVSSQRMVFLIADLLNVSRLKTGKFVIEPSSVNLSQVVNDEVNQLKETAANRSLELTYIKPANFPTLMIDETKIRQVIMNFIDNAIYYTPAGGKINVELIDNPLTVELRVSDNGIGVPRREQPHLFTKFYRAGNARQARPDGTGLGLFMAKKVIVAQGGVVIFESQEGKGSTFGFVFPKAKLVAPSAPQAQVLHH